MEETDEGTEGVTDKCKRPILGWLARAIQVKLTRDALFAALGSYGMITEIRADQADQVIVLASLALLGAPVALRADEKRHEE